MIGKESRGGIDDGSSPFLALCRRRLRRFTFAGFHSNDLRGNCICVDPFYNKQQLAD